MTPVYRSCRIGCASGFWGDTTCAAPQLVRHGNIDYLALDYLSEITMSLLTAAKQKSPEYGYTPDFVHYVMTPLLTEIKQRNVKVLANAGGVNPHQCAKVLAELAASKGVELNIAVVEGDDLMPKLEEIRGMGIKSMDSEAAMPTTFQSMNAYLGAYPLARCLDHGADVVVTGRCVDSALILAPLIHEYGWKPMDYNQLATGSLAGHLVECGAQATGGIFTDWEQVNGWENIGFPVVEFDGSGDQFVLTKPPNTGGLVTVAVAAEQMLYEIGDPASYQLPDVTCDFTNVHILPVPGKLGEAVRVSGAKGRAPGPLYKVSATYADGYRATAVCVVVGPRAADKAMKTANSILARTRGIFKQLNLPDYTDTNVKVIGTESIYGPHARPSAVESREVTLWFAVSHSNKKALEIFSREIAPAGTGMAPGLTGLVGGRPKVSPVLKLFSFLCPKDKIPVTITVGNTMETVPHVMPPEPDVTDSASPSVADNTIRGTCSYKLSKLANLRSGDKGDTANIGVIARHPAIFPYLKSQLTAEVVQKYFYHLIDPSVRDVPCVTRYELPGTHALNFVLQHSLGGGGVASLRFDPQGKAYGQMLADLEITEIPNISELS